MTNRPGGTEAPQRAGSTSQEPSARPLTADEELEGLRPLDLPAAVTVHDLAALMGTGSVEVIKAFMRNGYMYTVNDVVEHDIVAVVTPYFGYAAVPQAEPEAERGSLVISHDEEDPSNLEVRPPVVTMLGHVDHGKTTLLDAIRKSNVVTSEAGGITQHIGAYRAEHDGRSITFLDTPGHEAFTAMRARGAQVTDIAVLVVAADDGIMPQTTEAIDHARAAGVPILVAISKVDKGDADVERVKRQLAEHELLIEEWGGDVIAVPVSGLTGEGVPEVLENILVVSEVSELKANPLKAARGVVVEARRDSTKGTVASILVQTGTLNVGDNLVIGGLRGRIRAMFSDRGERIDKAGPSEPVEVLGISGLPQAGEIVLTAPDEKTARRMVDEHIRETELERESGTTLEDVHARIESGEVKGLDLVVKTDVQGTVDAVQISLERLGTEQTRVNVIHAASGNITENDVLLAAASQGVVIGFNSRPEPGASVLANQEGVEIRFYDVIYNLIDDVENALQGMLEPVLEDVVEGRGTIRAIFELGRRGKVAGFYVDDGRIARDSTIHLLRDGKPLFVGPVASLKHLKDDAREVTTGFEGGVALEGFDGYEEGDIIEAHRSRVAG